MTTNLTKSRKRKKDNSSEIKKEYFNWLCKKIERRRGEITELKEFIYQLFDIEFYSLIPNDDNRAIDGIQLRDRFIEAEKEGNYSEGLSFGPCTILEMLISLADRMDFMLYNPDLGKERCEKWFWMFIDNLKLYKYDNDDPEVSKKRKLNNIIIRKFLERDYDESGKGGIFPLKHPTKDQRYVEIWYQMMSYISENCNG